MEHEPPTPKWDKFAGWMFGTLFAAVLCVWAWVIVGLIAGRA